MINRSIRGLYLVLALCIAVGSSVQAQIKTTTFNNQTVKANSIVVTYDNTMITTKGKAVSPKTLAADIRTMANASIATTLDDDNVEEWVINGDYTSTLEQLNRIPGVRAFPNYVFYRNEMEALPIDLTSAISMKEHGENPFPQLQTLFGDEIVMNGGFEAGLTSWETFVNPGTTATIDASDSTASITDITGINGVDPWLVQLNQILTDDQINSLVVGGLYELSFTAATDSSHKDVNVFFGHNGGGWESYGQVVTIDDTARTYTLNFYLDQVWDNFDSGMKLGFEAAFSAASLFLDDVSLRQVNSPIDAAPYPDFEADSVISLFSDAFMDVPVDTFITGWSNASLEIDTVDGDAFLSYSNLDFVGIETVNNQIDISDMTHVRFDLWTPNADVFRIKLVDFGPDGVYSPAFDGGDDTEHEIEWFDLPQSVWLTFEIPLYVFENMTGRNNLAQIIFSGSPPGEVNAAIDNLMFFNDGSPTNDPLLSLQYGLNNDGTFNPGYSEEGADVDAFAAWELTTGSDDVIMVVYDDGVDFAHPDLYDNRWVNPGEDLNGDGVITPDEENGIDDDGNGYPDDFWGWSAVYDNNSFLNPGSFHGTHVAGILGAQGNNGIGISGVAQDVKIINVMIFDEFGGTDAISIMRGYEYISNLLNNGVSITGINQSWGGGGILDYESDQQFITVMTDYALHHNIFGALWIVSAGNSSSNRDDLPFYSYPNNIQAPNVVTVASTDDADNISGFSDFGEFTVDVAAPGSDIISTFPPSAFGLGWEYAYLGGTSMAAPHVSGIIALAKSLYPDETGHDLLARLLAGNEDVAALDGLVGEDGRVNALGTLDPAGAPFSRVFETHFHRTFVDGDGLETTGFVNNSGADLTVLSYSFTGPDKEFFYLITDDTPTLSPGESFGIMVGFNNSGATGDLTAKLEVETDAGTVKLNLIGHEQGFGYVDVSPWYENFGSVPYGTELNTSFTISNFGNGDMFFDLQQFLYYYDFENSIFFDELITFEKEESTVEKTGTRDVAEMINDITAKMMLERGDTERPVISVGDQTQSLLGPELVWFDDLNDADSVDFYWDVLDFSDGEGDVWNLVDVGDGETDNVFLFGDFDFGYLNNSATVAASPMFDLTSEDPGRGPAYLMFDVLVEVEDFWDEFFLNIVVDGVPMAYIGGTNSGEVINYGGYQTAYVDISRFIGYENVEFWFIAVSDFSISGGFGALFDNVGIVVDDFPIFTSINGGELEPGESVDVDLTIRTTLLPPGDGVVFTDVYANGFFSAYGNGGDYAGHIAEFSARNVALEINPWYQYLGIVDNEEPISYSFDATNVGTVPVDYFARTFFSYYNPVQWWGGDVGPFNGAGLEAEARFAEENDKTPTTINIEEQREYILSRKSQAQLGNARESISPRMNPTIQSHVNYFEDFESGVLPDGWEVGDESFGLGSVFEVKNIGSEDFPYHTLIAAEIDEETGFSYIRDNTRTIAFSPYVDVSGTPTSEGIQIRFDYSFLLEPFYDVASVWIGYTQDGEDYLFYLGSSEDIFYNDGWERNVGFNFGDLTRDDDIYIAFLVESDYSVQSAWAYVDNIEIFAFDRISYVDTERGTIDSAATKQFDVTVNTPWMQPGDYEVVTVIDYYSEDLWIGRGDAQYTGFSIPNERPVAEDDHLAVITNEVIPLWAIVDYFLSNDYDVDGWVWLYDWTDPLYGDIKYTFDGPVYVAPEVGNKVDMMQYIITDGQLTDTGTVYISVGDEPHFPVGADQQFVFLEDETLTMNTIGMAAGVGFWENVFVWANPHDDGIFIDHSEADHNLTFSAADDLFGQFTATLYVGTTEAVWDSMDVSIIVTPVNDAPVAEFGTTIDGSTVTFTDLSSDAIDMNAGGIVSWAWDFGDGKTSTDMSPVYDYGTTGDFTVTLVVTDNGGLTDEFIGSVEIVSVSNEVLGGVPTDFAIEQNYPNPFNPSTNINYSLPEASKVTIVVYDMLGQRVAELVNAEKSAGYHTIAFDASNLSSGVYIYQIRAGAFTQTKKMMLIK